MLLAPDIIESNGEAAFARFVCRLYLYRDGYSLIKRQIAANVLQATLGAWWLIGRFDAFRKKKARKRKKTIL